MKFNLVITVFLILFGFSMIIPGILPSFSQTVDNPQLFTPVAIGATSNIQIPTSDTINQTKIIQVNMNALKAEQVDVTLFGNTVTISKDRITTNNDYYTWFGSGDGINAVIVVDGQELVGQISTRDGIYGITGTDLESVHLLLDVDTSQLPPEEGGQDSMAITGAVSGQSHIASSSQALITQLENAYIGGRDYSDNKVTIDVYVAYTATVENDMDEGFTTPSMAARLAVELTNDSYNDNHLPLKLNLADLGRVRGYTEPSTSTVSTALTDITDTNNSLFNRVRAEAVNENADVVIFFVHIPMNTSCGEAGALLSDSASSSYAVVGYKCIRGHTFAHEIGHLQGAGHNKDFRIFGTPSYTNSEFSYGHGYYELPATSNSFKGKSSIMSYDCVGNTPPTTCKREGIWSDPHDSFIGSANPAGTESNNWNAKVLFATGPHIASLRGPAQTYDSISPSGSISLSDTAITSGTILSITATFSEEIHTDYPPHLTITDGTTSTSAKMTKTDNDNYILSHTITQETGTVTISFSNARDIYGNQIISDPTSGNTFTVTPSTTKPTTIQPTNILFSDDFESALTEKWIETGEGDWRLSTSGVHLVPVLTGHASVNKVLHSDNCDTVCTVTLKDPIDLRNHSSATLSFYRFMDSSFDRGEYLKVDLFDGTNWNTIYHWSPTSNDDDNTWHDESYDLLQYLNTSNFKIRFETQQSSSREDVQIDDLKILAIPGVTPTISNPTPPSPVDYSVYVADTDDREILVFSKDGVYLDNIVPRGTGGLGKAWDVTFGPDGHMYVTDNTYKKIRKYNGVTGAPISGSNGWATTVGYPNGFTWNDNTLYVATGHGIERFSSSGTSLGFFGDASRNPSTPGAPSLRTPYDVVFCPDGRMYVSDRSEHKILYYSSSDGLYLGDILNSNRLSPNTYRVTGLECTSGNILYQSGDDGGRVNKINSVTGSLIYEVTSDIDEPYFMDIDDAGNVYVANKDDDNIVKITPEGTTSVFASHRFDDPRGVSLGPVFSSASGTASGAVSGASDDQSNDEAEFYLMYNGTAVTAPIHTVSDITVSDITVSDITVHATDLEGDAISITVTPDMLPESAISVIDYTNGTATISINSTGILPGSNVFWVNVSDADNYQREPYVIIIPE